tara:strand:+ start:282 stop:731 length:450 start_codon:yes stop_codon:yes gene_type:complete
MKRIFFTILFFVSSCGYQPVYLNKSLNNMEFSEISHQGEININRKIINSLSLKKDKLNKNLNELFIKTSFEIAETSKNSKGQVESYRSSLYLELEVKKDDKIIRDKKIVKNFSYNNLDNKYELVEYQNEIKTDLIKQAMEEVILFLNLR